MTHDELYDEFAAEIRALMPAARAWREERLRGQTGLPRHVGPPASHPRVIEVVRRYYFACDRLNQENEESGGDWMSPAAFLLEAQGRSYDDVWTFVTELPFLPIGYDADGNPV